MNVRPVIFSAPMVLALLRGDKTQTRRLAWGTSRPVPESGKLPKRCLVNIAGTTYSPASPWQRLEVGDLLYVREAVTRSGGLIQYAADHSTTHAPWPAHWKRDPAPGMHMPRAVSRLTLLVQDVRRERLQDITLVEAMDEGMARREIHVEGMGLTTCYSHDFDLGSWFDPRDAFRCLWNWLHGQGAWEANPEVMAVTFKVYGRNVEAVIARESNTSP